MDRISKNNSMDRISQLTEAIQHHILGFLERDQVARAAVLSKEWRSTVQSLAVIDLHELRLMPRLTTSDIMNLVQDSINNFIGQNRSIQRFSLYAGFHYFDGWDHTIDKWMQQLVGAKVEDLSIVLDLEYPHRHLVPNFVLSSQTITRLRLHRCFLGRCRSIRLPNLIELNLHRTSLNNDVIQECVSGSPNLEILKLFMCDGITNISVLGHAKLHKVDLALFHNHGKVKIVAPKLRVFKLRVPNAKTNLSGCESTLRKLRLSDLRVTKEDLTSLVSKFPGLEEITLDNLSVESIEIPNQNLGKLKVIKCTLLETIEIGAPNLSVLKYCHNKYPFYYVNSSFSLNNTIDFYATFTMDGIREQFKKSWLASFKELVPKINEFRNIKLIVKSAYRMDPIVCDEVDENFIEFLSNAKYMQPRIEVMHIPTYEYMVDHLLNPYIHWKFGHWEIRRWVLISVVSRDKQSATKLLEVLSKKSLKENAEPYCCRSMSYKCWKHHLYHAEVITEEVTDTLDLYHVDMSLEKTETSGLFKSFDAMKYEITRIKLHWI